MDFSQLGSSISKDTSAFDRIKKFSKSTTFNINKDVTSSNSTFSKINNLYLCGPELANNGSSAYGSYRQHTLSSVDSLLPSYSTLVDNSGANKFYSYSLGVSDTNVDKRSVISNTLYPSVATNSNTYAQHFTGASLGAQVGIGNLLGNNSSFFTK